MTGGNKSVRDLLAGKELIGFKKASAEGSRAVDRASSAKVTVLKAPKVLQRSSTAKVSVTKSPRDAETK